jgi:hypothetical protein
MSEEVRSMKEEEEEAPRTKSGNIRHLKNVSEKIGIGFTKTVERCCVAIA